jgi:hypothetical protein
LITSLVWISVTLLTPQEPESILLSFYRKVRPDGCGWKPIARQAPEVAISHDLGANLYAWILGCLLVYCSLFGVGKLILHEPMLGCGLLSASAASAGLLYRKLSRI